MEEENGLEPIVETHTAEVVQDKQSNGETFEFDFNRLAGEVDKMFQEKSAKTLVELDESLAEASESRQLDWCKEIDKTLGKYKEEIAKTLVDSKDQLIAEIARGRTEITMPSGTIVNVDAMAHPETEKVIASLNHFKKAMLVGPAGTGKTYMVNEIAKGLNLPFYKYSCSRDSSVHDLLGYKQPSSETYLETVFLKAYENGGIFLVDEYDAMSGDMALFFNGVADSSKFLSIPHRDSKPIAEKHKDFYIIMCGNTYGKGSTEYSGRDFQDLALLDRFRTCRHHVGYHHRLEKKLMGDNHSFATKLRSCLEEMDSYLSTRNIEDVAILMNSGSSESEVVTLFSQDMEDGEKESFRAKFETSFPTRRDRRSAQYSRGDLDAVESELLSLTRNNGFRNYSTPPEDISRSMRQIEDERARRRQQGREVNGGSNFF